MRYDFAVFPKYSLTETEHAGPGRANPSPDRRVKETFGRFLRAACGRSRSVRLGSRPSVGGGGRLNADDFDEQGAARQVETCRQRLGELARLKLEGTHAVERDLAAGAEDESTTLVVALAKLTSIGKAG